MNSVYHEQTADTFYISINYRYETPSVWVVGLVIFILAYIAMMAFGIWFYCKYCRGGRIVGSRNQNQDNYNQVLSDQKAIKYDQE